MALRAGLLNLEEAVAHADNACAVAGRAGLLRRARTASGAVAARAFIPGRNADVHLAPVRSILKAHLQGVAHVVAAHRLRPLRTGAATATASEEVGEDVAEGALEVAGIHSAEAAEPALTEAARAGARRARINPGLAEAVVGSTLLLVGQNRIGFADLLELFFSSLVARIAVRVIFHGKTPIGLLDVVLGGSAIYAEHLVIVLFRHVDVVDFKKLRKGRLVKLADPSRNGSAFAAPGVPFTPPEASPGTWRNGPNLKDYFFTSVKSASTTSSSFLPASAPCCCCG